MLKMTNGDCCSSETVSTSKNSVQKTCMLIIDNDDNYDDTSNTFVQEDIAQQVASSLSLPILQVSSMKELTSSSQRQQHSYTHGLCIVPYQYDNCYRGYALAIVSFERDDDDDDTSPKRRRRKKKSSTTIMKPFYVDFCPPPGSNLAKRLLGGSGADLLLKAVVGSAKKKRRTGDAAGIIAYDLTAGFGQDSLLIASAGSSIVQRVHMVEQDPIVGTLLQDALRRVQELSLLDLNNKSHQVVVDQAKDIANRLTLQIGKGQDIARDIIKEQQQQLQPDIIYLDPMFPPRTKSASVKKNMQILHGLLDSQQVKSQEEEKEEEYTLLQAAYHAAKVRVVVKRPSTAKPLGIKTCNDDESDFSLLPSHAIQGSGCRWDVYMKQQQ